MCVYTYMNIRFKQLVKNLISVIHDTLPLSLIRLDSKYDFLCKNSLTKAFHQAGQIKSYAFLLTTLPTYIYMHINTHTHTFF